MKNTLGNNVRELRQTLGYTQSSFARKIKTSQSAVAMIEAGTRNPSFGVTLRIKRALGVTWSALLRGIE